MAHRVAACPECGGHHRFALLIGPAEGPLLFAGEQEVTVDLLCPRTMKPFRDKIIIGSTEKFLRIADPFANAAGDPRTDNRGTAEPAGQPDEYAAWLAGSRQTALDYCRTMLTASSAAIPVYFAVLEYLGTHQARPAGVASLPAIVFLIAAGAFAAAQRPRLQAATRDQFPLVRDQTLRRLNRFATLGTVLFLLATVGSVAAFAALL